MSAPVRPHTLLAQHLLIALDERRLVDTELNAAEWYAAPVQKAPGAVENAAAGGWSGGEKGWRAAVLKCGGERGWWLVGHDGERRSGMVVLEHAAAMPMRRYGEWRGTDNGLTSGYGWR